MRKLPLILIVLLVAAILVAMPFLCTYSNIRPEVSTAYYEYKAQQEALTATGPEAELMRLLTGLSADTKLEPVSTQITFQWFGLELAWGTLLCIAYLLRGVRKTPTLRPALLWTAALAVPLGFLGARLVYCLVNLTFYLQDIAAPLAMLKVWEGGLSLSGALMFSALSGVIGAKIGKASVGEVLDLLTTPLLWLIIFVNMAVSTLGMGFGPEVNGGFMAIDVNGVDRLDTPYLAVMALMVMMFSLQFFLRRKAVPTGTRFALYAFLYGAVMILLESLRKDGHMVWGFVHAEMVFDLLCALGGLLFLARTKKRLLLSLLFTALMAGAVVALEFALDRSAIGDGLLYTAYIAVLGAYLIWGCTCAKLQLEK